MMGLVNGGDDNFIRFGFINYLVEVCFWIGWDSEVVYGFKFGVGIVYLSCVGVV